MHRVLNIFCNFFWLWKSLFRLRASYFLCLHKESNQRNAPRSRWPSASLAERALLQGRFDAHPCLSKLKWPSLAISPWQNPLCEATLKGPENQKKTATARTYISSFRRKPESSFCFFLLAHSAIYRTAQATQGEMHRVSSMLRTPCTRMCMAGLHQAKHGMRSDEVHFSFDKQGRASKRPWRALALLGNPEGVNCVGLAFFGNFLLRLTKSYPPNRAE